MNLKPSGFALGHYESPTGRFPSGRFFNNTERLSRNGDGIHGSQSFGAFDLMLGQGNHTGAYHTFNFDRASCGRGGRGV